MDSTGAVESKRRWGVNLTTWLAMFLVLHPLSFGPLLYLELRGWLRWGSPRVYSFVYAPEIYLLMYDVPFLEGPSAAYRNYVTWWQDLARVHVWSAPTATPVTPPGP